MIGIGVFMKRDEPQVVCRHYINGESRGEILKDMLDTADEPDPSNMMDFILIPTNTAWERPNPSKIFEEI